ncbi:MAG: hypothetical protein ACRC7O_07090 [Fimbriiglobus sp.]
MARSRLGRTTDAPARNDVYVGMLVLTCVAMFLGIGVLVTEGEEYGWESKPKAGPSITLPSLNSKSPDGTEPPAAGAAAPVPTPAVVVAATSGPAPRPAPVLTPIARAVPAPLPGVIVPAAPETAPLPGILIPFPPVASVAPPAPAR